MKDGQKRYLSIEVNEKEIKKNHLQNVVMKQYEQQRRKFLTSFLYLKSEEFESSLQHVFRNITIWPSNAVRSVPRRLQWALIPFEIVLLATTTAAQGEIRAQCATKPAVPQRLFLITRTLLFDVFIETYRLDLYSTSWIDFLLNILWFLLSLWFI